MSAITYNELLEDYTLLVEVIIECIAKGESVDELMEIKRNFDRMLGLPEEGS